IINADIKLEVNQNNQNNYSLFKKPDTTAKQNPKHIAIQKINLIRSTVSYEDYSRNPPLKAKIKSDNLTAFTTFSSEKIDLKPMGNIELVSFNNGEFNLPENQAYEINSDLTYWIRKRVIDIHSGNLKNDLFHFKEIFGSLALNQSVLEISLKANDFSYSNLNRVIPKKYLAPFGKYQINAQANVALTFKGALSNLRQQYLAAKFSTSEVSGTYPANNISFAGHSFSGEYLKEKGKPYNEAIMKNLIGSGLVLNKNLRYEFEFIKGNGSEYSGNVDGNLSGQDILSLYPDSPAKNLTGDFVFNTHIQKLKGEILTDGELEVKNGSFNIDNLPEAVTNFNTSVLFNNAELAFQELNGNIGTNDFSFSGIVINPLNIGKEDQPFLIEGDFTSGQLRIDQLMGVSLQESSNATSTGSPVKDYTPAKGISINVSMNVDHLFYKRFYSRNLNGRLIVKDQKVTSEAFDFESIGGTVSGAFSLYPEGNFLRCKIDGDLKNLYADSIFYVFENFDQNFIEDRHLKGQISANTRSDLFLTTNLTPVSQTLKSTIDASIVNGRLVDFQPMYRLSRFVDEEQLAELSFSRLTNKITIQDSKISIPEMKIESNISNIELSGWHTLDQNLEYHLKVPLKKKYKRDKDERFGIIDDPEKNVSNLFLKITGNTEDYKFAYDRIAVLNKVKSDIKKEGRDLIRIFQQKGKQPTPNTTLSEDEYFDFGDSTTVKKDSVKINQ
ncbi:MAG: AsmA-like C-terminal region-containing protein, partial [Bacteroidota bacterium]